MNLSERLRAANPENVGVTEGRMMDEAADEIDRLQGVLDAIDALHPLGPWHDYEYGDSVLIFGCTTCRDEGPCPTHLLLHPEETE